MANYIIKRELEPGRIYGCTNWSTLQESGQVASDFLNAPLDGTIVWNLYAAPGYEVSVDDFYFPGANVVSSNSPPGTYLYNGLPAPILGASMVKVNSTHIRITLYLIPSQSGGGSPFTMPNSDIDIVVNIEGCARVKSHGHMIVVEHPGDIKSPTRMTINSDLKDSLTTTVVSNTRDELHGVLPSKKDDEDNGEDVRKMSYEVVADDGYRYESAPTLSFTDKNYYAVRRVVKEDNPLDASRKDITSVSFDIYKKN